MQNTGCQSSRIGRRSPRSPLALHSGQMCLRAISPAILAHHHTDTAHLKVMRVESATASHDQWWCSEVKRSCPVFPRTCMYHLYPNYPGTYNDRSFLEGAIVRPRLADATPWPWLTRTMDAPVELEAVDGYDSAPEVRTPEGGGRWPVQRNVCAEDEWWKHVVV